MKTNTESRATKYGRLDGMAAGWSRSMRAASDGFMARRDLTESDRKEYNKAYDEAVHTATRLQGLA